MDKTGLVEAVKAHAIKNYEKDGWDVLIECYEDEQIAGMIGKARTEAGAIKKVGVELGIYNDYRNDIMATAF